MTRTRNAESNRMMLVVFPYFSEAVCELTSNITEILEEIGPTTVIGSPRLERQVRSSRIVRLRFDIAVLGTSDALSPFRAVNWLILFLISQLEMTARIIRHKRDVDTIIFFLGSNYTLPLIVSKMLRRRTILIPGGSSVEAARHESPARRCFAVLVERIGTLVADVIGLEHESEIMKFESLHPLSRGKFTALGARYVDMALLSPSKPFSQRSRSITFLGRLNRVKGVEELLAALPHVANSVSDYSFWIIGDGPLRPRVLEVAGAPALRDRLVYFGWVSRERLANLLSDTRLVVMPSYSEGLPTVMLEAMSCGTPCLVSPVGATPGIVKEGSNGFLLSDRSPCAMARRIVEILARNDLETISQNARDSIETSFSKSVAVKRFSQMVTGEKNLL